jgi:hypothetical protein
MIEIVRYTLAAVVLLVGLLLIQAPGILAALAAGFLVVCLAVAERISGVPPGTFVQQLGEGLSGGRDEGDGGSCEAGEEGTHPPRRGWSRRQRRRDERRR